MPEAEAYIAARRAERVVGSAKRAPGDEYEYDGPRLIGQVLPFLPPHTLPPFLLDPTEFTGVLAEPKRYSTECVFDTR